MSRCDECRRALIWARTIRGNLIALDYAHAADDEDAFMISGDTAIEVPLVQRFEVRQDGRRLYPPHRLFCKPAERVGSDAEPIDGKRGAAPRGRHRATGTSSGRAIVRQRGVYAQKRGRRGAC